MIPGCDGEIVLRIGADGLRPCVIGVCADAFGAAVSMPVFRQRIGQQRHLLAGLCGGCCGGLRIPLSRWATARSVRATASAGLASTALFEKIDCACVVCLANGDLSELKVCGR